MAMKALLVFCVLFVGVQAMSEDGVTVEALSADGVGHTAVELEQKVATPPAAAPKKAAPAAAAPKKAAPAQTKPKAKAKAKAAAPPKAKAKAASPPKAKAKAKPKAKAKKSKKPTMDELGELGPTPKGLGESAGSLARLFKKRTNRQPMKSRASRLCLRAHGRRLRMSSCRRGNKGFFFDRLGKQIKGGPGGRLCVTRRGKTGLVMARCNGKKSQKFTKQCGAFVHVGGDKKVIESVVNSGGRRRRRRRGGSVKLTPFAGVRQQLWHYKEFVRHSKCRNKRYKVMKFHGRRQAVVNKALFAMPTSHITLGFWMKASRGTPFSYSSKHVVDALTVTNPKKIIVYVAGQRIQTSVTAANKWTHIAVSWDAVTGLLEVHKNGRLAFSWEGKGKNTRKPVSAGGCAMIGQRGKKACSALVQADAFEGEITDLVVWRAEKSMRSNSSVKKKIATSKFIRRMMYQPVAKAVVKGAGKLSAPTPSKNLRWAVLSRQYASQELGKQFPPKCNLKKHKRGKKVRGPGGHMYWGGSGDVHYHTFSRCYYDDQSVGEWMALQVHKDYRQDYPLTVQFRTSPQRQRCSWCQNGAVSYIDGCAIKYGGSSASAGFGGFNFPRSQYRAYAAFNGKHLPNNRWRRDKNMRVYAYTSNRKSYGWGHGNFRAYLTRDSIQLICSKGSIRLRVPRKLRGKVSGLAGTGIKRRDWIVGPNPRGGLRKGSMTNFRNYHHNCAPRYQYPYPNSPYNGNRQSKPIVKWFNSWGVDGKGVPSVFTYRPGSGHNAGSFNRIAGQKIKPIKGVGKNRPKGAKSKAKQACRVLRNAKKAFKKCVFDYMVLGPKAVRRNIRDRMAKRKNRVKRPTLNSVRDISAWKGDAQWIGSPSWGCVEGFDDAVAKVKRVPGNAGKPKKKLMPKRKTRRIRGRKAGLGKKKKKMPRRKKGRKKKGRKKKGSKKKKRIARRRRAARRRRRNIRRRRAARRRRAKRVARRRRARAVVRRRRRRVHRRRRNRRAVRRRRRRVHRRRRRLGARRRRRRRRSRRRRRRRRRRSRRRRRRRRRRSRRRRRRRRRRSRRRSRSRRRRRRL